MCSLGCKLIQVLWIVNVWLLKGAHFVWLEGLTKPVNNQINILPKHLILFLTIKYAWILSMPSFLTELWSSEKSYLLPFKEISVCSSSVKSFDTLPKQTLYHLVLSFSLNVQISVLFTYIQVTLIAVVM